MSKKTRDDSSSSFDDSDSDSTITDDDASIATDAELIARLKTVTFSDPESDVDDADTSLAATNPQTPGSPLPSTAPLEIAPRANVSAVRDFFATRLKQPPPAPVKKTRARKVHQRKTKSTTPKHETKGKTAAYFVAKFPDSGLTVSTKYTTNPRGELWCSFCAQAITLKKSTIGVHVNSDKHKRNSEIDKQRRDRDKRVVEAFQSFSDGGSSQSSIHPNKLALRFELLKAFLKGGIPLFKVQHFKAFLEMCQIPMPGRSQLGALIQPVVSQERDRLRTLFRDQDVSICFDGTSRGGETLGFVARAVDKDFIIVEKAIALVALSASANAGVLTSNFAAQVFVSLGVAPGRLVAISRDGASVNEAACQLISRSFQITFVDVTCYAHALNNAGEKFQGTVLNDFASALVGLQHSEAARNLWASMASSALPRVGATRWWSTHALFVYCLRHLSMFKEFIEKAHRRNYCKMQLGKLKSIFEDESKLRSLTCELAIAVDALSIFADTTKILQSSGPIAVQTYDYIMSIQASVTAGCTDALNSQLSSMPISSQEKQALREHALSCVRPCFQYFQKKFIGDAAQFKKTMNIFRACRLFDPVIAVGKTCQDINDLQHLPFIDEGLNAALRSSFYTYQTYCKETRDDVLTWWRTFGPRVPAWAHVAKKVFLLTPTSAACERMFSRLHASFTEHQDGALMDLVEGTVLLQFNDV